MGDGYNKMIYSREIKAVTRIYSAVNINHRTRVIADRGLETISLSSRCERPREERRDSENPGWADKMKGQRPTFRKREP